MASASSKPAGIIGTDPRGVHVDTPGRRTYAAIAFRNKVSRNEELNERSPSIKTRTREGGSAGNALHLMLIRELASCGKPAAGAETSVENSASAMLKDASATSYTVRKVHFTPSTAREVMSVPRGTSAGVVSLPASN